MNNFYKRYYVKLYNRLLTYVFEALNERKKIDIIFSKCIISVLFIFYFYI